MVEVEDVETLTQTPATNANAGRKGSLQSWVALSSCSFLSGCCGYYVYSTMKELTGKWTTIAFITGVTGFCLSTATAVNLFRNTSEPAKRQLLFEKETRKSAFTEEARIEILKMVKSVHGPILPASSAEDGPDAVSNSVGEMINSGSIENHTKVKRPYSSSQHSPSECTLLKEIDIVLEGYQKMMDLGRGFKNLRASEVLYENLVHIVDTWKRQKEGSSVAFKTKRRHVSAPQIQRSPRCELPPLSETFSTKFDDLLAQFMSEINLKLDKIRDEINKTESLLKDLCEKDRSKPVAEALAHVQQFPIQDNTLRRTDYPVGEEIENAVEQELKSLGYVKGCGSNSGTGSEQIPAPTASTVEDQSHASQSGKNPLWCDYIGKITDDTQTGSSIVKVAAEVKGLESPLDKKEDVVIPRQMTAEEIENIPLPPDPVDASQAEGLSLDKIMGVPEGFGDNESEVTLPPP